MVSVACLGVHTSSSLVGGECLDRGGFTNFPKNINGSRVIYNKYMDTVLLLVKGYWITNYLIYSWTGYATPVAYKVTKFKKLHTK